MQISRRHLPGFMPMRGKDCQALWRETDLIEGGKVYF